MQRVLAAVMAMVFVLSGYGVSLADSKGHERKGGQEVERGKDKHKDGDKEKDKDEGKDDDAKEKVHKEGEGDRESDRRSDRKHGLDRADEVAGEHGKKGRDNARKHQD